MYWALLTVRLTKFCLQLSVMFGNIFLFRSLLLPLEQGLGNIDTFVAILLGRFLDASHALGEKVLATLEKPH